MDANQVLQQINSFKQVANNAKAALEKDKNDLLVKKNDLKHKEEEKKALEDQCKKIGIEPSQLEAVIQNKTNELLNLQQELTNIIPQNGQSLYGSSEQIVNSMNGCV